MNEQNKKVPTVRFKGFTNDWEQHKLGEISFKVNTKNKENLTLPVLSNSAEYGIVNQEDYFDKKIANRTDNYYIVKHNDFVYNPRISKKAPYGPIRRNTLDTKGLMSPLYYVFRINDGNYIYLDYYFKSSKWYKFMYQNGDSGARSDRFAIKDKIFQMMPISMPNTKEQNKIGQLIQTLQKLIDLQQRKLDLLKQLKKGLLQKMFAEKNSKQPVLRFKGFHDDWEQRKLGEVAEIKTGSRNHQDSVDNGKYPFFVRSEKVERLNEYDFDTKAILVPGDGRIGEIFHYYDGKFALHQRVYKVDNFKEVNPLYLLNLFKYKFKKHALRLNSQGTVPSLRLPMFTNWNILIPNLNEQQKIGLFFQQFDSLIALHQRKQNHLKLLKKSLLQQMFI